MIYHHVHGKYKCRIISINGRAKQEIYTCEIVEGDEQGLIFETNKQNFDKDWKNGSKSR